jgi:hypothetical protein
VALLVVPVVVLASMPLYVPKTLLWQLSPTYPFGHLQEHVVPEAVATPLLTQVVCAHALLLVVLLSLSFFLHEKIKQAKITATMVEE